MPNLIGTVIFIDLRNLETIILESPVFREPFSFNVLTGSLEVGYIDAGSGCTYTILDSSYDQQFFAINKDTGFLEFTIRPDIDNPVDEDGNNIYEFVVSAHLNGYIQTREIRVTVIKLK